VRLAIFLIALLLTACATTPPIEMAGVDPTLTPDKALSDIDAARGKRVAWGGAIVNTKNLKDTTEIEVLGYPLAKDGRPDLRAGPQHRFLLVRQGYLEAADYRNGRLVSAVGAVNGTRKGMVGEAPYVYPVLQAEEIYLWPLEEARSNNSGVNFGIGVGVIFGR
jgi:outer membrane lipoprotein